MRRRASFLRWTLPSLSLAAPLGGQEPAPSADLINLFFDCSFGPVCDLDYVRREVPFVNFVRDRADADVHVLVTSQVTGGGGRMFTLAFLGLRRFAADDQELTYATAADATTDDQRRGVVGRLRLGLVRYVQGTPAADGIQVTYAGPPTGARARPQSAPALAQDDPWDFWVFRLGVNGGANGERTSTFSRISGRVSANRTTDAWKVDLSANFFRSVQEFEFVAGGVLQRVEEIQNDWRFGSSLVRSIGERWAVGLSSDANSSTRLNQDFVLDIKPGVEFNFFPYSESTRRSLTLQYLVGPTHLDYTERTIFGHTAETRLQQSLTGRISLIEPWGRWSTSVTGAQYLHDTKRYNVTIFGNANVRVFRGFSVFVSANYQWVRDQLYLALRGATTEQVLLRQRQLETSYRYFYNFGIEYRFGSIFNNVVNPRFGGGGGDFFGPF